MYKPPTTSVEVSIDGIHWQRGRFSAFEDRVFLPLSHTWLRFDGIRILRVLGDHIVPIEEITEVEKVYYGL